MTPEAMDRWFQDQHADDEGREAETEEAAELEDAYRATYGDLDCEGTWS